MAAKGEALRLCRCGNPINVQELREQSQAEAESIHLTKTPAGISQWLKGNYGYEVSRKRISNWLNRGKLPSSRPVDDATGSSTYGRFLRWLWAPAAIRL